MQADQEIVVENQLIVILDSKPNRQEQLRVGAVRAGFYPLVFADWAGASRALEAVSGHKPQAAVIHMNDVPINERDHLCARFALPKIFFTGGYPPLDFGVDERPNCFMIHRSVEQQYGVPSTEEWDAFARWLTTWRSADPPAFLLPRKHFQALPALRWLLLGHHAAMQDEACAAFDTCPAEAVTRDRMKALTRAMASNRLAPARARLGAWWVQAFCNSAGDFDAKALEQFVGDFEAELGALPLEHRSAFEPITIWLRTAEAQRARVDRPGIGLSASTSLALALEHLLQG